MAYKLPEELVEVIENRAVNGLTKTDVVVQALRKAFNIPEATTLATSQHLQQQLQEVNQKVGTLSDQTSQIIEIIRGLMARLRSLELANDGREAATDPISEREVLRARIVQDSYFGGQEEDLWLTKRQAFILLNGDTENPDSAVEDLEAQREVRWHTFRKLKPELYACFGFEYSEERADHNKPCMKPNSGLVDKLTVSSLPDPDCSCANQSPV